MRNGKVIWGAGIYGGRFFSGVNADEIAFFIDEDRTKNGKLFCGKIVRHPQELSQEEWGKYFFFIPKNYEDEISRILEERGLKRELDFITYGHILHVSKERAEIEFDEYRRELSKVNTEDIIPIFATYWRKHGYINFFSHLKKMPENYLIVSEIAGDSKETSSQTGVQSIQAPVFADYETIIDCEDSVIVRDDLQKLIDEETEHVRGFFPEETIGKCRYSAWMKYRFIECTLDVLNCEKVIAFSSVTVEHRILDELCKNRGIQILFTHPGIVHGTLSFDVNGEVGESIPAICPHSFCELPVSCDEIKRAEKVKEYLYQSRLNRKVQPKSFDVSTIKMRYEGRPVLCFAGQNDVGSCMVPYTDRSRRYYSPIFKSTIEAVQYLAKLCKKNQWNFIYKPHPMYIRSDEKKRLSDDLIYIDTADINDIIDYSDVIITILSTSNYDALVRDKPVVTLGYSWAKKKGINYEAWKKEDIEIQIKKAIEFGFTYQMKQAFIKHIAQCLKYYLYDNGLDRPVRYGKKFPDSFEGFYELYCEIGNED